MRKALLASGGWVVAIALVACTSTSLAGGGGGGSVVGATTNAETLSSRVLEHGTGSHFDGTVGADHELVAEDAASWQALYQAHHPGGTLPIVDFTRERVVGVILGRPTTGYAVQLVSVTRDSVGTVVTYEESPPGEGKAPIAVLTQPYFFAAVPRVPGSVTFRHLMAPMP